MRGRWVWWLLVRTLAIGLVADGDWRRRCHAGSSPAPAAQETVRGRGLSLAGTAAAMTASLHERENAPLLDFCGDCGCHAEVCSGISGQQLLSRIGACVACSSCCKSAKPLRASTRPPCWIVQRQPFATYSTATARGCSGSELRCPGACPGSIAIKMFYLNLGSTTTNRRH